MSTNQDFQFIRPGGLRDSIPALRLRTFVNLVASVRPGGKDVAGAAYPECVLDTGCHLSVIPEYIWHHFKPGVVTPLPFNPTMPLALRSMSFGGNYPYELGELTIRLLDQEQRTLGARIIAQLTRDGGAINLPMTLGLRGGVIDGRILRAEPDVAAPFGQTWFLQDP